MIVEIIPKGGLTHVQPLRLEAAQVVIRQDNGTPICVAALFGMEGAIAVSKADDSDFNTFLRNMGLGSPVSVDTIQLPPVPQGAVLLADPRGGTR